MPPLFPVSPRAVEPARDPHALLHYAPASLPRGSPASSRASLAAAPGLAAPGEAASPSALYAVAFTERLHSPERLRERAAQLRTAAGRDAPAADLPAWSARAQVLEANAHILGGEYDASRRLVQHALGYFLVAGDAAGAADARDVLARLAIIELRLAEARELLQRNLALPEAARSDAAWCATFYRMALLSRREGGFDEALRWHYRNVAMAARSGQPAEHAQALAGAGGLQLDLFNTDDARSLLAAAWEITNPSLLDWCAIFPLVAGNLLVASWTAGDVPAVRALSALVQPHFGRFSPLMRRSLMQVLACSHAEAGDTAQAEALLAGSRVGQPDGFSKQGVCVMTESMLALQRGDAAGALRLCDDFLAAQEGRVEMPLMPTEVVFLHRARLRALQALGDEAGALAAERTLLACERALLQGATRAQRLTLQVRHELEAAERARDEAQQRAAAAQRERERLAEVNAALAAASRAKTQWMASASHDLRQPLQALGLQLARLKPMLSEPGAREVVLRIEEGHAALRAMFDALLNLSRIEGGAVVPQRQPVPLRPLCARLVEEMAPLAEARGLRLALYLPTHRPSNRPLNVPANLSASTLANLQANSTTNDASGAPGPVVGDTDPALLEAMLRNLIDNAIKYTAHGGVVLALRPPRPGRRGAAKGWRLQVRDTGPGIDEGDHARAFGEFVRLGGRHGEPGVGALGGEAATHADGTEGLGLGLSIVQRLARLLGHAIELRSRLGRGCLFEITVAAHAGAHAGMHAGADAAASPVGQAAALPAAQSRQIFEAL